MATKLRNFKYNPVVKLLVILLAMVSVAIATIIIVIMVTVPGVVSDSSYYASNEFNYDYGWLSHNAVEKYLLLKSEKAIIGSNQGNEVEEHQLSRLRAINDHLSEASSFIFVLEDKSSGRVITNIAEEKPIEHIQSRKTSMVYESEGVYLPEGSVLDDINSHYYYKSDGQYRIYMSEDILDLLSEINEASGSQWVYYTAIMDLIPEDDTYFYENQKNFRRYHVYQDLYIVGLSLSGIALLFVLLYLIFAAGKSKYNEKSIALPYDEIPHELQTMISLASFMPFIAYMSITQGMSSSKDILEPIYFVIVFVEIALIGILLQYCSLMRLLKTRSFLKKLLIVRVISFLIGLIRLPKIGNMYKIKVLLLAGGWLCLNGLFFAIMMEVPPIGFLLLLGLNVITFRRLFRFLGSIRKLMDVVHQRRNGDGYNSIDISDLSPNLREFGQDLETLKEGLDLALEERVKGEKLKTELITNVTHDLKNPLTSIISYVELLKGKETYDEDTKKYIHILDEKANRLKGLINQLVDASKASAGSVDVRITTVDMVQLTRQLCGEFSEGMEESNLVCILPDLKEPKLVLADPMILYRILENLMSNVCNYSMNGTRVYVDMVETQSNVSFSLKNISSEALNIDVKDLSRRFVRGDSSRNTEGSGLGLSIALSLAKLIKAELNFSIDGDLFKAVLVMPKGIENPMAKKDVDEQ